MSFNYKLQPVTILNTSDKTKYHSHIFSVQLNAHKNNHNNASWAWTKLKESRATDDTTLHNTTQRYTTLHNITQHYTTLHDIT